MLQPVDRFFPTLVNSAGVYDVVLRDGTGLGRYDIQCPFAPDHDKIFLRKSTLIVIQGGEMIARAMYSQLPDGKTREYGEFSTTPPDEVRVRVFDLSEIGMADSPSRSGFR